MNKSIKIAIIFIVVWLLAIAGAVYYFRITFSDNGGASIEDAIVIIGTSYFRDTQSVFEQGVGQYLKKYGKLTDYDSKTGETTGEISFSVSDFIAKNDRRYMRALADFSSQPDKYGILYFDVTDILKNKELLNNIYMGGDGSSLDSPVLTSPAMANNLDTALNFIFQHIEDLYGVPEEDWQYVSESVFEGDPEVFGQAEHVFQQIDIKLSNNSEKSVYFEVTDVFKKFIGE